MTTRLGYAALATAYYTRTWFSCKILLILCDPNVGYEFMSNDFMPLYVPYMIIPCIPVMHACTMIRPIPAWTCIPKFFKEGEYDLKASWSLTGRIYILCYEFILVL